MPDYTVNTLLPPTTPTTLPVARSIPRTHPAPPPAYDIVQLGLCNDLGEYVYERALTPYISQTPSFRQDGALSGSLGDARARRERALQHVRPHVTPTLVLNPGRPTASTPTPPTSL